MLPSLQRLKIEEDLGRLLDVDGKTNGKKNPSKTERAQAMDEAKRSEYEEVSIGWQQKLFCRREWDYYNKGVNEKSNALEKKYFEDIQRMT